MKKINKVLLVDDDYVLNFLHQTIFLELNIADEILIKENGEDALKFIKRHCLGDKHDCPNLILLDLNMPIMGGLDLLEELKRIHLEELIGSRIVVVTSSDHPKDTQKLKSLGVKKVIEKPLTVEKTIRMMEAFNIDQTSF